MKQFATYLVFSLALSFSGVSAAGDLSGVIIKGITGQPNNIQSQSSTNTTTGSNVKDAQVILLA